MQTGAVARMLKAVPDANLGLTWDPNNAATVGGEVVPGWGDRQLASESASSMCTCATGVTISNGTVEWAAVGTGEFDNARPDPRSCCKDGYDGPFTLETHWRDPITARRTRPRHR